MPSARTKPWFYSHLDVDAGLSSRRRRDREEINLIISKILVHRERLHLWKRKAFNNRHFNENFLDKFNFRIYSHPIQGAKYQKVSGSILWRDWYQYRNHPSGARSLQSCDDPEIVAVILDGSVVVRSEHGVVTDRMRDEFQGVFDGPLAPIDEVLRRHGYQS